MSTPQNKPNFNAFNSTASLIGDEHVLCILYQLSSKEMRFNEIQRAIEGMSPTTLTARLKKLESEKLIQRKEETLDKISVTYSLTEKGKALLPVMKEIAKFAEKFVK